MKDLREEIDAIDDQILSLLNRRAQAVVEVGKIKTEQNLRYYVPEREVEILPRLTVSEVFGGVEGGNAGFGVVPIENSSEGIVSNTLDMFVDHNLLICGEILIEVDHDLLSVPGDMAHCEKVYSHPP